MAERADEGRAVEIEQQLQRADGEYRWHFVERVPLRDDTGKVTKWYSSAYDIEDQKQAESALQLSRAQLENAERELRLTLDTMPTFAWRTRADGFAEYLNKPWLDYTGLSLEQALGWEWQIAIHPDDRPHLLAAWERILASGRTAEVEARLRRFDGAYRWFLFRPAPLYDDAGNVVRWYGTNTDIEIESGPSSPCSGAKHIWPRRRSSVVPEALAIMLQPANSSGPRKPMRF